MFSERNLPQLDDATLANCERVERVVRRAIADCGGAIRFDEYMRIALYQPGLGYYLAGTEKFGRGGDFITAPDLSPLFGSAIAAQCAQVLGGVARPEIVEFGGGSGALACSVLAALQGLGVLPERYTIIELSPELQSRQSQLLKAELPDLYERVHWTQAPPAQAISGCVIANEVLDALPVRVFENCDGGVYEHWVGVNGEDQLDWIKRAADTEILTTLNGDPAFERCRNVPGYRFEICTALPAWIADLNHVIEQGVALLIDYGSGRKERFGASYDSGSLRCFLKHHLHDQPLIHPGGQDITASVDFTLAAEAAVEANLQVAGFVEQAHFLTSCGILDKASELQTGADEQTVLKLNEQLKTLLLPTKMGTRFKVLALTKHYDRKLLGFTNRDDRRSL